MATVIAVVNQKGGVGKTTTTINIGAGLHRRGYRVLLVDLDPQASLTLSLGIDTEELEHTIADVLTGEATPQQALISKGYDVLPADISLTGAEQAITGHTESAYALKDVLEPLQESYDYILIDCSPSLGLLTVNALTATQKVYIPTQAEYLAMAGLVALMDTVQDVQQINPELDIAGVLITMYDKRKNISREVVKQTERLFNGKVFKTRIRRNIALEEAPTSGMDIYEYAPKSNGAKDYGKVVEEITKREANK